MRVPVPFVSVRSLRRSVAAALCTLAAAAVSLPGMAKAQTPTVVHVFTGGDADGASPVGALIQTLDGSFYSTTTYGGTARNGTVFQVTASGAFSVLFSFGGGNLGGEPTAGLIQGTDGNFYGTTQFGGYYGEGTLFRLTPAGVLTVLVDFVGDNGEEPISSLVQGPDGSFYGTTLYGGYNDQGTVFQYTPTGAYNVLFYFGGGGYGKQPAAPLVFGPDGNLYGSTQFGGYYGDGTIFQITTSGVLTVLHDFDGNDGADPQGGLTLLPGSTTFYGTASENGANGFGTVFEITTAGTFTKLHDFTGSDGNYPQAALIYASNGLFYGTTFNGGDFQGDGTVFSLTPAGVFTSLTDLNPTVGRNPAAPLLQGADGALYGTAYSGGGNGDGTIFRLDVGATVPTTVTPPGFFTGETALGNGVDYLVLPNGNVFGYYSFLSDPSYIYHFDLGYEYVINANDGQNGVYLYDFASSDFFYTSPVFPFPYLYDFNLKSTLYYYANPDAPGHYTTNPRYFYDFGTGQIITK